MVKDIIKVLLILAVGAIVVYFSDSMLTLLGMETTAIGHLLSGLSIVLPIVAIPFQQMLQFPFIYELLAFGVMIYTLSYIFKYLTGHHLEEEDDSEQVRNQIDNLSKEELLLEEDSSYWNYRKANANSEREEAHAQYRLNRNNINKIYNKEKQEEIFRNRKGKSYKWKRNKR